MTQPEAPNQAPPVTEPLPLLTLSDGIPEVVDTTHALAAAVSALRTATGPISIDAERASGYRYSARAYLIQLRRAGAGTHLIDPSRIEDLSPLAETLAGTEWILHAATQDLPCLNEVGLVPTALFDTELAARLLGYPRVGLATLVEEICGLRMRKEHSAADWSTRPLPQSWLEYAALDVEVLDVLRERLHSELEESGKLDWATQEFEALLSFRPTVRVDPWRRTSQMHRVRGRRGLAAVRALWTLRDELAQERDVTPSWLLPDSAIVAAAQAMPTSRAALLALPAFKGRGVRRHATEWFDAVAGAARLPESDLPAYPARSDAPPPPRAWADRNPEAAARLDRARPAIAELSERLRVPIENLMTPDTVRRVLWDPPTASTDELPSTLAEVLRGYGARQWQIDLIAPVLLSAITAQDASAVRLRHGRTPPGCVAAD